MLFMKYSKKRAEVILNSLRNGNTRVQASKDGDINYVTFNLWCNTYPEFKKSVDDIIDSRMATDKEEALNSIRTAYKKGIWTAGAWLLERKYPEEYALRKQQLELSGTIEHKQLVINVLDDETRLLMDSMKDKIKLIDKSGNEIPET